MSTFKDVNIFISGGAGVIGTALVERLHQQGAHLFVGDLKTSAIVLAVRYSLPSGRLKYVNA